MSDALLVLHHEGTTLSAAALDRDGAWLARREMQVSVSSQEKDRLEVDAHDISLVGGEVMSSVVEAVGPGRIAAVGVVGETGSTVLWERVGSRPFTPVVLGSDRRGDELCRSFRNRGWNEAFQRRTGRIPEGTAAGFRLSYLLSETPRALDRAANGDLCFGSVNSYLIWRLSGSRVHAIDRTDAAASMLFNLERMAWDNELLEVFTVPSACLPAVLEPASLFTETRLGSRLPSPVPLGAAAAIPQAILVGLGRTAPGDIHLHLDAPAEAVRLVGAEWPLLRTASLRMNIDASGATQYATAHRLPIIDALSDWTRALGLPQSVHGLQSLTREWVDPGTLRFTGDSTTRLPRSRRAAREAAFSGDAGNLSDAAYFCALIDVAAHEVRATVDAMTEGKPPKRLTLTGEKAQIDVLAQRIADLTGVRIERANAKVCALTGGAALAALTVGWAGAELSASAETTFVPSTTPAVRRRLVARHDRRGAAD